MTQEFVVRLATDKPVRSSDVLRAMLGIAPLSAQVQAVEVGGAEDGPQFFREILRRLEQQAQQAEQQSACLGAQ